MMFPELGSLVQLRSGGPVLTVVSVRRKTGQVVCMWFRPGTAKVFRLRFSGQCLSTPDTSGAICEGGGLWGRWIQKQTQRRTRYLVAPLWTPRQPWWVDDPSEYPDHGSDGWLDSDENLDDDEDDDEEEEQFELKDREVDHEDFVDEMDTDSESYARSHDDGWFYSDDDPDEVSSDDEEDYDDHAEDEDE